MFVWESSRFCPIGENSKFFTQNSRSLFKNLVIYLIDTTNFRKSYHASSISQILLMRVVSL